MDSDKIFEDLGLIAINIIAAGSSNTLSAKRDYLEAFVRKDLKTLSKYWTRLSDQTQMMIFKAHQPEFLKMMSSFGEKENE